MARSRDELLSLLTDLESDQVERKESLRAGDVKERIYQTICGFANDMPDHKSSGVVFVGASDDGRAVGLTIDDRLLLERWLVSGMCSVSARGCRSPVHLPKRTAIRNQSSRSTPRTSAWC